MKELFVALVVPIKNNKIDEESFINLIKCINDESDGILILGSTMEERLLTDDEKDRICEIVSLNYHKKIMIGLSGKNTSEIINDAKKYEKYKVDMFLIPIISYIRPSQSGIIDYYMEIADKINTPIIIYEVCKRSGERIRIDTLKILKNHKNIIGIKDASSDINYTKDLATILGNDFLCYCGDDSNIISSLAYGASGVISVSANKYIKIMRNILEEFPKIETYKKYKRLIEVSTMGNSPLAIKYLLGEMESKKEMGMLSIEDKNIIDNVSSLYN